MLNRQQWGVLYRALLDNQIIAKIRLDTCESSNPEIRAIYARDLGRANEALQVIHSVQVDWSTPAERVA